MENREKSEKKELVSIYNREKITISGVMNIEAFDEEYVMLDASMGAVSVEGEGLKVITLSHEGGEIIIVGKINGVSFFEKGSQKRAKRGLFK